MRLRLYHHSDGTRVAYRELGAGRPLALLHSALLSHREWEPSAEQLAGGYRVVLPDLPLHGDSEDDPRHPYTIDWYARVIAGFAADVLGPNATIGGHGMGADIALRAMQSGQLRPRRLVLMSSSLHAQPEHRLARAAWRAGFMAGAVPGLDRMVGRATRTLLTRPGSVDRLTVRANPAARDLLRHAFADAPGNRSRARSWAKCARCWPRGARTELLELYPRLDVPVLLLWADHDRLHPIAPAEDALRRLAHGELRVLPSTGFLMAYDDPVGLARELAAFCG